MSDPGRLPKNVKHNDPFTRDLLHKIRDYFRTCRLSAIAPLLVRHDRNFQVLTRNTYTDPYLAILDGEVGTGTNPYTAREGYRQDDGTFVMFPGAPGVPAIETTNAVGLGGTVQRVRAGARMDVRFQDVRYGEASTCTTSICIHVYSRDALAEWIAAGSTGSPTYWIAGAAITVKHVTGITVTTVGSGTTDANGRFCIVQGEGAGEYPAGQYLLNVDDSFGVPVAGAGGTLAGDCLQHDVYLGVCLYELCGQAFDAESGAELDPDVTAVFGDGHSPVASVEGDDGFCGPVVDAFQIGHDPVSTPSLAVGASHAGHATVTTFPSPITATVTKTGYWPGCWIWPTPVCSVPYVISRRKTKMYPQADNVLVPCSGGCLLDLDDTTFDMLYGPLPMRIFATCLGRGEFFGTDLNNTITLDWDPTSAYDHFGGGAPSIQRWSSGCRAGNGTILNTDYTTITTHDQTCGSTSIQMSIHKNETICVMQVLYFNYLRHDAFGVPLADCQGTGIVRCPCDGGFACNSVLANTSFGGGIGTDGFIDRSGRYLLRRPLDSYYPLTVGGGTLSAGFGCLASEAPVIHLTSTY